MNNGIKKIVESLDLQNHPEGGYYKETYRSQGFITQKELCQPYGGSRNFSTCIYYLLTTDTFSAFHRIHQDEIWHFYQGIPLRIHIISPEGVYQNIDLGHINADSVIKNNTSLKETDDLKKLSFTLQGIVFGGSWFAAEVLSEKKGGYSLIGCTVAPGFHFDDFELADRETMVSQFPKHSEVITKLTRV